MQIEAELKMASTKGLGTSNMHLFNAKGQIAKYDNAEAILDEFCVVRLDGYVRRRADLVERLKDEADVLRNRVRFVELVVDGTLKLQRSEDEGEEDDDDEDEGDDDVDSDKRLEADMERLGLERMSLSSQAQGQEHGQAMTKLDDSAGAGDDSNAQDGDAHDKKKKNPKSFKYLLSMPMASMTRKRKAALDAQLAAKLAELARAEASRPTDLWLSDLDALEKAFGKP